MAGRHLEQEGLAKFEKSWSELGATVTAELDRQWHDRAGGNELPAAIALNGASQDISDPAERSKIAADGWARWAAT